MITVDRAVGNVEMDRTIGAYWRARQHVEAALFIGANGKPVGYQIYHEGKTVFEASSGKATAVLTVDHKLPCEPSDNRGSAHTLGCMIHVLAGSSYHAKMTIGGYLEEDVLPPLNLGYVKVFIEKQPTGLVTWGFLDNGRLQNILSGERTVTNDDWGSGDCLMIHDVVATHNNLRQVVSWIKSEVLPGRIGVSIRRAGDGTIQRINRWKGVNVD